MFGYLCPTEKSHWKYFFSSLQLSFNGADAINAGDTDSLASLGFVSGDAIYILGISHLFQQSTGQQLPSNQSLAPSISTTEPTANQRDHISSVMDEFIPSTCLSETPDCTVSSSFSKLFSVNPNKFNTIFEEFCGLLHLLITETGFKPHILDKTTKLCCYNLPDSWKVQHETLKLNYFSPYPPFSQCTLVITAVGQIVMVYGLVSSEKSLTLKLKPSDFITNGSHQNLKKLSLLFKNEISYPLLVMIQRKTNGPCPYNFSNLPPEISNNILLLLDARSLCRLSQVSHQFQELSNQTHIWRKLLSRNYGISTDGATPNKSLKELYKAEYTLKQKQQRVAASILQRPPPMFPTAPVFPTVPLREFEPRPFPGIIGGDADLFPDLRGIGTPSRQLPFSRGANRNHPFFPSGGGNFFF